MKNLIYLICFLFIISCKDKGIYPCVDNNCTGTFWVDTFGGKTAYLDNNNFWHVKYIGLNYFQIKGKLSELNSEYVINGVPLIETDYDSDYWVLFDTIRWKIPLYSRFGLYADKNYKTPIPVGTLVYDLKTIADGGSYPTNIVGYQLPPKFGYDKPYASTLLMTYSKYNYEPRRNVYLDKYMIGDTANIYRCYF